MLHTFSSLTEGDVFQIEHNDQKFSFTVLETRPRRAIDINNIDIEVEFLLDSSNNNKENVLETSEKSQQSVTSSEHDKGQVVGSAHTSAEETVECENWCDFLQFSLVLIPSFC